MTTIRSNTDLELTNKTKMYRWNSYGEYNFTDNDRLSFDPIVQEKRRIERIERGFPSRYSISFNRKPMKRKKDVLLSLDFDDKGNYECIRAYSTGVTKKELKMWENEALGWLTENGVIRERKEK